MTTERRVMIKKQLLLGVLLFLPMMGIVVFWCYCWPYRNDPESLLPSVGLGLISYVPFMIWQWCRLRNQSWLDIEKAAGWLPLRFVAWWGMLVVAVFVYQIANILMTHTPLSPADLSKVETVIMSGFVAFGAWAFPSMYAFPVAFVYYKLVLLFTTHLRRQLVMQEETSVVVVPKANET